MFIHHILWFKSLIHLKEACAHGSRWARKEETPLSKTAEKQPNCFVLLSLWGFYTQKHGGRGFQRGETKLHLRGIERSQIQPFCWYTLGSQAQALHTMQHPQPSCVDQLGPPFVGYFLYSPHPSRHKGPLQVALSLCESYQLQTANGVLQCWEVVDSICLVPFFKFFFWCQKSRASRIAIQTPCGFTNICCWQGTYPKLWENIKQEVACCEQSTAVGYNTDSQENGFILRNEDFVFSFKVHRCLWGAFTVKCYRCFPKDVLRQRKQNQELQGSRLQTVNSWKQYVSHFYWKVFVGFHDCGSFWHVIELSARQSKALFALCVVCLVVGMGVSCIFTHGFPSVKGKWRGALGANTKTGGLGRDLEEHKHTGTRVNNRHLRKWWYGLFKDQGRSWHAFHTYIMYIQVSVHRGKVK